MPVTDSSGRGLRSWPMWAVPVVAIVLAAAVAGGIAARSVYGEPTTRGPEQAESPQVRSPDEPPGSPRVRLGAGAAVHPDHEAVRQLLQRYFNAINLRDYGLWSSTVVPAKQRGQPERQWRQDYDTTYDGSILVQRIVNGPDGSLRVLMSFTSVQEPDDAPKAMPVGCLRWHVVYQLVRTENGLRLGKGLPGSSLFGPC